MHPQMPAETRLRLLHLICHHPPPGRRGAPPEGRLQRVIQYAAAYRLKHRRLWNTGSPVKLGDDSWIAGDRAVWTAAHPQDDR